MSSVDFSNGNNIIQWRFPNAPQDSSSLNFVKNILEIITSAGKFNNCNGIGTGQLVSCDNDVMVTGGYFKLSDEETLSIRHGYTSHHSPSEINFYFVNNYNLNYAELQDRDKATIRIRGLKIKNEECQYAMNTNYYRPRDFNSYNGKCDDLLDKVTNFLRNSAFLAQTTYTPPASDSSNAGQISTIPSATPNSGQSSNAGPTAAPPAATPSPGPSSHTGPTPQTSATPNNAGQSTQTPTTATPSSSPSSNVGQTPQPFGSSNNNHTPAPGSSAQSNTRPQNSNPPLTPNHNRSFILAGGTAVIGGGLAYAGYKARQAQAHKTKERSTQSLQHSTKFRI
jgi:hypothetical protein